MAKRTQPPTETPPTLTKEQGRQALLAMKEKGEKLLTVRPIAEAPFNTWSSSTADFIRKVFGLPDADSHIHNFYGGSHQMAVVGFGGEPDERYEEHQRANDLKHGIDVLASLIEQLDMEMALESPSRPSMVSSDDIVWSLLHAKVTTSAKARLDAGHYADAVEAAFKELNTVVKEMVRKKTGQEYDGASLMMKAFSPNAPVLVALDDLSTESGNNIQQGYMQIFAGAMTGIRNPKAHENLTITKERAIHLLFLASLLFHKLDERP
jgi:uncharacterized protein (TIGR02391 family)